MTYVYNITLNTTSETYSFTFERDQPQPGRDLDDIDASGLAANVSALLTIQTQADSPEANTLIFLAYINVPDCTIQQGKPIGLGGYDVVKDTVGTDETCIPTTDVDNQTSIWTTQDLSSGEFKNVYYNASTSQEAEDPLGYKKLIVSALRTLQSYYNGSEAYEHISSDRYGNSRTVHYKYIGKLGDAQCWQADGTSVNEDEIAADSKRVCWSPAGGVSNMTGGDATELGTIRDESEVIAKVVASSRSYAELSENGTLEVVSMGEHTTIQPGLGGPWIDLQQGAPLDEWRSTFFALNSDGELYRQIWQGSSIEEERYSNITFSELAGGPPVELPGRYRSQWALDTVGAIWVTYDTTPTPPPIGMPLWTNYTDPENLVIGTRAIQLSPFHNSVIQVAASIYGFFVSDDLTAYILYQANGNNFPSVSDFPSLNVVEERRSFLQLAPVGPSSSQPVITAIGDDESFYYSVWNPANPGLINPADGFSDWQVLDLGGPASKLEPWRIQEGFSWDEGIFVVMKDSTVLSIQRDPTSATGWGTPQHVAAPQETGTGGNIIGAIDVSFDRSTELQAAQPGKAFVGTFSGINVSTIAYQGSGSWIVDESWKPFLNYIPFEQPAPPPEHGFPAMTGEY
ncbi:uncharacterized protein EI97DRAFT_461713 [Westerdykella ornata]|uniref:Fucose-specific lectin n=1 Tax=Westerdykella ornata TaxID=318751 RepID=A0A6A6J8L8_WESOR|nr:uncharacterized protein EI97DRAFT_461713 [Westerdykella ornata]KAF2272772.1 hypothetical protein EI97DRAFT_461713 [Westerdykella ornata]